MNSSVSQSHQPRFKHSLNSHLWLVAAMLDSADRPFHRQKFPRTVLNRVGMKVEILVQSSRGGQGASLEMGSSPWGYSVPTCLGLDNSVPVGQPVF